jgi:SAM-dependent methyltransferase
MIERRFILAVVAAGLGAASLAGAFAQHMATPPPEQNWQAPRQSLTVPDFPANGLILDIGGGGWGVIGQIKGRQVIAIDILENELLEAPPGPLVKIIMDARRLQFLENTFPTVTAFFTFMYIAPADHELVFREIRRVLALGGRLMIWDVVFPKLEDPRKKYGFFPFTIMLPDRQIQTGYAAALPPGGQGLPHFLELANKTGYAVVSRKAAQDWFYLELSKPGPSK